MRAFNRRKMNGFNKFWRNMKMINKEFIIILLICAVILAEAQRPYFGACPKVKSATNVRIDKVRSVRPPWWGIVATLIHYPSNFSF